MVDKAVLSIATGGTIAHLLAIDYGLKPLLTVMGSLHQIKGIFLLSSQITFGESGALTLDAEGETRIQNGTESMLKSLSRPA